MFCFKCGTQIPHGSGFCLSCGTNLTSSNNSLNNTISNNGKCLFSIERKEDYDGMESKIKIYIDGLLVKELANGEKYAKVLNNGKHIFYCDVFGMNRPQSFEFIGDNNTIEYVVQFPSITEGRTLLVNKTLETQPGTYKTSNAATYGKTRHGFTTFWFMLIIIAYGIRAARCIFTPQTYEHTIGDFLWVFNSLVALFGLTGAIMLLRWKKAGFWIEISVCAALFIVNCIILGILETIFSEIITVFIRMGLLYAAVKIHKNGKTTWEQLE